MPFGAFYAAIVFAVLGPWSGLRLAGGADAPLEVLGASVTLLSLALAAGLVARRAWARWLGVAAAAGLGALGASAFLGVGGGAFDLLRVLAGALAAVLLVVPATGRPSAGPAVASAPSRAGRVVAATALIAIVGCVAATAWAVARVPTAPRETRLAPTLTAGATWLDFAPGLTQAKSSNKLMVVDFYATWCNPCKIMEKRTFRDPRVEERLKDVVPVRVDSEEETERGGFKGVDLALRYAIEVYPTVVVIDGDGREVARNVGMLGAEEFLSWLDAVLERASTTVARS